jgi:radical SAM/Cys-rich protein
MLETWDLLKNTDFPTLRRDKLNTVQINLGYLCNQQCLHCHVNAGPKRTENMTAETVDQVLSYIQVSGVKTVDLTGGAPELNPHFRRLVSTVREWGIQVLDRCNLSVLFEPEQETLAEFLAENQVEIMASLPCYLAENVDQQRGKGVYDLSIKGLQRLNALGYGRTDSGLTLNLVYNPIGASLPPPQVGLERDYKEKLKYLDIEFNQLYTLSNMPIKRFGSMLLSKGEFEPYMNLLKSAYCPDNLAAVMCRHLISIDWQGYVYDCDFNQMLDLNLSGADNQKTHILDLLNKNLEGQSIAIADHCYGCTAGQGSSCGGALS